MTIVAIVNNDLQLDITTRMIRLSHQCVTEGARLADFADVIKEKSCPEYDIE